MVIEVVFLELMLRSDGCPKMALGATGVCLRSPVLFSFPCENQKTLAAQSYRQWHPLFNRDNPPVLFHPFRSRRKRADDEHELPKLIVVVM